MEFHSQFVIAKPIGQTSTVDYSPASPPEEAENVTRSIDYLTRDENPLPEWASFSERGHCSGFIEQSPKEFFGPLFESYNIRSKSTPGNWSTLFGVDSPSKQQDEAIAKLFEPVVDQENMVRFNDLLLEGDRGTGKTTVALAAAVGSVLLRGEHAVIFVRSAKQLQHVSSTLERTLRDSMLSGIVTCGLLRSLSEKVREGEVLPDIQIGTVKDFDSVYFDRGISHAFRKASLRCLGMLIIDDIDEFSTEDRVQLPFTLQKIRLLQKASRTDVQFLVTTKDNSRFSVSSIRLEASGHTTRQQPNVLSSADSSLLLLQFSMPN